jgi:hypothetical protein
MQGTGILFSEMTPPPGQDAAFHGWYDEEHIPIRMKVPGFLSGRRYAATGDAAGGFLAVYEVTDLAAFSTPEYQVVKTQPSALTKSMLSAVSGFTRYLGREISVARKPEAGTLDTPILYAVWFTVPEAETAEFDAWYDQDHTPLLMASPHWKMVRRFAVVDGEPEKYNRLALHYLSDMAAMTGPERDAARATPWRARMAEKPWFKGSYRVFTTHGARMTGRVA